YKGYGGKPSIPIIEIKRIIACAKEGGINILDTAESYECQDIIRKYVKGFCIYTKTRDWKVTLNWGDNELRGILYHYLPEEAKITLPFVHRWVNVGVSIYGEAQLPFNALQIVQMPFSIDNWSLIEAFDCYRTLFIRS